MREKAAAMARKVRSQREHDRSGGFPPPLLPHTAEFPTGMPHTRHHWDPMALAPGVLAGPTGMPHNRHRWDPMALAPGVLAGHWTNAVVKREEELFDDYQQQHYETLDFAPQDLTPHNFALHEADLYHYNNPPFHAQRPSPHSTQSRAAFGGYQGPSAAGGQGGHVGSAASQATFDAHVAQFCDTTGAIPQVAAEWLHRSHGNYMHAVQSYFSSDAMN